MKIKEYLDQHPEINRKEFWRKVYTQYSPRCNENSTLTNFMVWMDRPFWEIEHLYDIAYERMNAVGDFGCVGTTFEFMVDMDYDPVFAAWLESDDAEEWFNDFRNI